MKQRLKFKCWSCQRDYSLLIDLEGRPKLALECPYCGKDGIVDLNIFRQDSVEVFKTLSPEKESLGAAFAFPDVILTTQPEH